MKLYEIQNELAHLWAEITEADEITPEMTERFNELKMARDVKLEYLAKLLINEEYDLEKIEREIKLLNERKKSQEKSIKGLSDFIVGILGNDKCKFPIGTLWVKETEALELVDGMEIPSQYMRIKTKVEETPDKELMKTDLKNGASLPFAYLQTNKHLQLKRPNEKKNQQKNQASEA